MSEHSSSIASRSEQDRPSNAAPEQLGVEDTCLAPPEARFESPDDDGDDDGKGIFSECPIFDENGEVIDEAEQAYYERAAELFVESAEGSEFTEKFQGGGWLWSFLSFGVRELGEIVDSMSQHSVEEYLFQYIPRKVSTDPESAPSIIAELTKFWEYVGRTFKLPNAESIIAWLKTDGLVDELEEALGDTSRYGMAKSFVMSGRAAGYDMTTEAGMKAYMTAFNQRLSRPAEKRPFGTIVSDHVRVGRNDPCPCGSGKKYKKCCLRAS